MARIYLLHGFNVEDGGDSTTGKLKSPLSRYGNNVTQIKYGDFGRARVRMCNKGMGAAIASMAEPGSVLIAHSNGAAIAYRACMNKAPFSRVILINPALDSKLWLPHVPKVSVFFSESDPWTRLAKYIPFSKWGNQGAIGYQGPNPWNKYSQWELDALTGEKCGHSGAFRPSPRHIMLSIIQEKIDASNI